MRQFPKENLTMDPRELVPFDRNPRVNDGAVEFVANSIDDFSFMDPIIVDESDVVLSGHTRLKAALSRGLTEVPVIRVHGMTEDEKMAYRIAANKTGEKSGWDFDLLDDQVETLLDDGFDMERYGLSLDYLYDSGDDVPDDVPGMPDDVPDDASGPEPGLVHGDVVMWGRTRLVCAEAHADADDVESFSAGEGLVCVGPPDAVMDALRRAGALKSPQSRGRLRVLRGDGVLRWSEL